MVRLRFFRTDISYFVIAHHQGRIAKQEDVLALLVLLKFLSEVDALPVQRDHFFLALGDQNTDQEQSETEMRKSRTGQLKIALNDEDEVSEISHHRIHRRHQKQEEGGD